MPVSLPSPLCILSSNAPQHKRTRTPFTNMSNTLLNSLTVASADIITAARSLEQNYNDALLKIGAVDDFTKKTFVAQWTDNVKVVFFSIYYFSRLMNPFSNTPPFFTRRKRMRAYYAALSTVRSRTVRRGFESYTARWHTQHMSPSYLRIARS